MGVLLVGVDRKGQDFAEAFLEDRGVRIRQRAWNSKGVLARALEIRAMPTSFLVSGAGQVIGKVEGVLAWDDPAVIDAVHDRLKAA